MRQIVVILAPNLPVRRFLSILLLLVFVVASVGVVHTHYTCSMTPEALMASKKCCDEGTDSCCELEVLVIKLKDDFVSSAEKKVSVPPAQHQVPLPLAEWLSFRSSAMLELGLQNLARINAERVAEVMFCCFLI